MGEVKQISIKNQTYYFYNDMINFKDFESNLLKIDKNITKGLIFITLDTSQSKKVLTVKLWKYLPCKSLAFAG